VREQRHDAGRIDAWSLDQDVVVAEEWRGQVAREKSGD